MTAVVLEGAAGAAADTWTGRGESIWKGDWSNDGRRERALSAEHNDRWTRKVGWGDGGKWSREGKQ